MNPIIENLKMFSVTPPNTTISEYDLSIITPFIGNQITPENERCLQVFTQTQLQRIAAVALIAFATIKGIFYGLSTYYSPNILQAIATITCFAGTTFSAYYLATSIDFDSPRELEEITDWIASHTLSEIAESYSKENIIGHALFGQEATPEIYVLYKQLVTQLQLTSSRSEQRTNLVNSEIQYHATNIQNGIREGVITPGYESIILARRIADAYIQPRYDAYNTLEALRQTAINRIQAMYWTERENINHAFMGRVPI